MQSSAVNPTSQDADSFTCRSERRKRPYVWLLCLATEKCSPLLPRKEVIHPQLPLRMPCYDFTLITNPTVVPDMKQGLLVLPALLVWRAIIFVKLRIDVPIVPADFPHTTSSSASFAWARRYDATLHLWNGDSCKSFQRWHKTFQSHFSLSVTSKHFFWRMEW